MFRNVYWLLLLIVLAIISKFLYSLSLGAIPSLLLSFYLFYLAYKEWKKRPVKEGQTEGNGQER